MIGVFQAANQVDLINKIEGTPVKSGSVGTNTAGSPNFSDATTGAFTGVAPGDVLQISGTLTTYVVLSVTNANAIVLTTNIAAAHTANAVWKIRRGGVGVNALLFESPYLMDGNRWIVFYETTNFGV